MEAELDFRRGLRALRSAFDVSQRELAERITQLGPQVDTLAVLRMEKIGDDESRPRHIRLSEAMAIAEIFGLTIEQICAIGGAGSRAMAAHFRRLADEIDGGAS